LSLPFHCLPVLIVGYSSDSQLVNLGFNEDDINFTLADYFELVDATGRSI